MQWCPRNPDLFATAFFDGTIGVHSIQSTNETNEQSQAVPQVDASDIFDAPGFSRASQATLSLKHPPKWLRRPISSSFGYGGKLVSVSNLPSAQGKNQSCVVHLRKLSTETDIVERAKRLQEAVESDSLHTFAEERSSEDSTKLEEKSAGWKASSGEHDSEDPVKLEESSAGWKALLSLFKANSRDELITLLGFSKEEVATRVAEAVAKLKAAAEREQDQEEDLPDVDAKPHEPVVSFAEPEREVPDNEGEGTEADAVGSGTEPTPSETSVGATSDASSATRLADGESTTTAPSLFGDDNLIGTPQHDAAADFFGSIGTGHLGDEPQVPHHNYALDSSVAATIGSGPSSVASEVLKSNTFRIYPIDESETDRLVTKALVLGDFESAVSLCLSTERYADAILLAVKGGPDLLQRTQKAYFERRTTELPYLRLFQSIVTNDLADIVQNADLQEWQEIFVVLCTFASQEEFSSLAEQLGQRLEFQANVAKTSGSQYSNDNAAEYRKNATLTYLAAGRLERLVNIWVEDLVEEEKLLVSDVNRLRGSRFTAHALALQSFIEKVTVFRKAINYEDTDLALPTSSEESDVRSYKLSGLYDRYFEYADLLASQGLVNEAVAFLHLTPPGYAGSPGSTFDFKTGRDRLLKAAGVATAPRQTYSVPAASQPVAAVPTASTSYQYRQYPAPQQPVVPSVSAPSTSMYEPYAPAVATSSSQPDNPYAPATSSAQTSKYAPPASTSYQSSGPYGQPLTQKAPQAAPLQPPPMRNGSAAPPFAPPPQGPPVKRDNGGWNDAPALASQRRTPAISAATNKPAAITSPFPNAPSPGPGQAPNTLPPPPRPGSVQARPPPPPQGQRMQSPPHHVGAPFPPPHARPPSGPPGPPQHQMPPPGRPMAPSMAPPQGGPPLQRPPPQAGPNQGQFIPPPAGVRATPPPGPGNPMMPPYVRATPPPGYGQGPPPHPGPGIGPGQPFVGAPPPQGIPRGGPIPPGPQPPVGPSPPGPPGPRGSTPSSAPGAPPPVARVKSGPPPPKYRK